MYPKFPCRGRRHFTKAEGILQQGSMNFLRGLPPCVIDSSGSSGKDSGIFQARHSPVFTELGSPEAVQGERVPVSVAKLEPICH